jgi:quercetin dioxygenase-like cupin family protein
MATNFRSSRFHRLLCAGTAFLAGGLFFLYGQDAPTSNYTGGTVTKLDDTSNAKIAHLRYGPGSRTRWHSHEGGRIILVEEGVALTQVKGGPVMELHAGETTYVGPGVVHWHGAAPDQGGVQFNISRGGITWLGEVTDAEFKAKPKR